jgi:hypothetical protein
MMDSEIVEKPNDRERLPCSTRGAIETRLGDDLEVPPVRLRRG